MGSCPRGFEPHFWHLFCLRARADDKSITTPAGFEPARAKPSRFLIYRLNHSATVSKCSSKNLPEGFEPPSSGLEPDVLTTTLWEVCCTYSRPTQLTVSFAVQRLSMVPDSLGGQDTRLSPVRPGFNSRSGNSFCFEACRVGRMIAACGKGYSS